MEQNTRSESREFPQEPCERGDFGGYKDKPRSRRLETEEPAYRDGDLEATMPGKEGGSLESTYRSLERPEEMTYREEIEEQRATYRGHHVECMPRENNIGDKVQRDMHCQVEEGGERE